MSKGLSGSSEEWLATVELIFAAGNDTKSALKLGLKKTGALFRDSQILDVAFAGGRT